MGYLGLLIKHLQSDTKKLQLLKKKNSNLNMSTEKLTGIIWPHTPIGSCRVYVK